MKEDSVETGDAVELLKKDHSKIRGLFEEFEAAQDEQRAAEVAEQAMDALRIHTMVEEAMFYPVLYGQGEKQLVAQSVEEHQTMQDMLQDLETTSPDDPNYKSKVLMLAEVVKRHFEEEELEVFQKASERALDLSGIGRRVAALKLDLERRHDEAEGRRRTTRKSSARGRSRAASRGPKPAAKPRSRSKREAKKV
jgi:hemerythrin-like domain-containing protein